MGGRGATIATARASSTPRATTRWRRLRDAAGAVSCCAICSAVTIGPPGPSVSRCGRRCPLRASRARVLPEIKKGDVVILQFGHNDNGARGALPGVGEEMEERDNPRTQQKETVHTFGWYLRQYIAEAREKGAEVVVCSL